MIEYRKSYLKGYLKYRASYTESFGVLLDENFHERNISNILKKKIAKSFGLSVFTVFFKHTLGQLGMSQIHIKQF